MSLMDERVERAQLSHPPGIEIAYETFGSRDDEPLLLVMGLGTQMLGWPDPFCQKLADRGFFVIRYDNRDIGLSSHLDDEEPLTVEQVFTGHHRYLLSDMAADGMGLLDALGIDAAHIVGVSMGGMIVQTMAIEHPQRVRSLTSIMSTTGDKSVGAPTEEALAILLSPPAASEDEAAERTVTVYRVVGSKEEIDEDALRERARVAFRRANDPAGVLRQLAAIQASPDRTPGLRELEVPALVIHGADDPLVTISGGKATADAIPDAEYLVIERMGHDLPYFAWGQIIDAIANVASKARQRA